MSVTPRLSLPQPQSSDSMAINPPAFNTIWSNLDPAIGPTFCTSATKPATPYSFQWIYLTDTGAHQIWDTVALAWITIKPNPLGILASTNSLNQTNISATGSKFMCTTLLNMTIDPWRTYRVHAEGVFAYTYQNPNTGQVMTQNGEAFIHYKNAATVATTDTIIGQQYVDAYGDATGFANNTAQQNFSVDGLYFGSASTVLSVGWSFQVSGTFNPTASAELVQNVLTYVEQV